jgi:MFS family permease
VIRSGPAILALLTALNLVNYIDRFLVNAVGPKFQAEFGLGDAELGFVIGAFMVGYMLTTPIFGGLGDRYARKWLIAAGVALWSIATVISGLTHGFASMLAARVAVGVGEASYATLGPTIIDDIAPKGSKNRYLAIFYAATPVGAGLGYIVSGILEPRFGWRSVFFIAGVPGLLLAATVLLIAEPARRAEPVARKLPAVYLELFRNVQYRATVLGYIAQTFALGGFTAWAAPFLFRKLCLALETGNQSFGAITIVTGLVGTAAGGILADRIPGEDRTRVSIAVCAWSSAIAAPIAMTALFTDSSTAFLVAIGITELAIFASVSPINAAILGSVRPEVRATAMAASIFVMHLLGDIVSQPLIGAISDRFGDARAFCSGGRGLAAGMVLLPVALALSALFWFRGAARPAGAQLPR